MVGWTNLTFSNSSFHVNNIENYIEHKDSKMIERSSSIHFNNIENYVEHREENETMVSIEYYLLWIQTLERECTIKQNYS